MLTVNRQDLAAMLFDGCCKQFACYYQWLFVCYSESLPLFSGGQYRWQACGTDNSGKNDVNIIKLGDLDQAVGSGE